MTYFGLTSLLQIVSHTVFIGLAFWALQSLQTEVWLKKNQIPRARLLYVFLAIAIGYTVSSFFLEFIVASRNLIYLF